MSERSAVDLAATVRIGLTWTPQKHQAAPIAALDALVARCKQAERERDRLAVEFDKWDVRLCASEARVAELEAAMRERDEAREDAESWKAQAKYNLEKWGAAEHHASQPAEARVTDRRDPTCVERWPECNDGEYDPRCCRFPKSCSCGIAAAPADTEKCDHWCSHTYNDGGNLCCGRCGAVSEVPVFNSQTNSSLTADTEGWGKPATPYVESCGDEQPHSTHEWIGGVWRHQCPGIPADTEEE